MKHFENVFNEKKLKLFLRPLTAKGVKAFLDAAQIKAR